MRATWGFARRTYEACWEAVASGEGGRWEADGAWASSVVMGRGRLQVGQRARDVGAQGAAGVKVNPVVGAMSEGASRAGVGRALQHLGILGNFREQGRSCLQTTPPFPPSLRRRRSIDCLYISRACPSSALFSVTVERVHTSTWRCVSAGCNSFHPGGDSATNSVYGPCANSTRPQNLTCRMVRARTVHRPSRPLRPEDQALTFGNIAQVMKDEAGRPFIIVREYVEPPS
jgi:hypothetical protein